MPVLKTFNYRGREMPSELSIQKAAQVWCKPAVSHKVMDVDLAEAFAETLDEIWSKPWLGNATTQELIDELTTRIEIQAPGLLQYKTTGIERAPDTMEQNGQIAQQIK
jgi:hypothetical protein